MAGNRIPGPWKGVEESALVGGGPPVDRPTFRPVRAAIGGFEPETAALPSLRISWNMDGKPMFAGPQDLLDQVLKQLMQATTVVELLAYIERILGPTSFAAGVVYGAGESVVLSVVELLDLMKTFVLAELYDKVNGLPAAGRSNDPGINGQIYNFAGAIWGRFMSELLKPAADERDAILHEVARIFEDPLAFFGSVAQEYAEKYRQFKLLVADHSLQSQFAAGKIFGEILLEVILLFIAGAGAVKTVSKAPKLVKLAKRLKGKIERKPKKILGAGDAPPQPPSSPPPQTRPKPQLKEAAPDPEPPKPESPKPAPPQKPSVTPDGKTGGGSETQLQAKFKHARDFGVEGSWNKANAKKFADAIEQHVTDPGTRAIQGTYRGSPVVHHVNPSTGLNVMKDSAGNFISGWKLNPAQLQNVLTRGSL